MTPNYPVCSKSFGGIYCLQLQGQSVNYARSCELSEPCSHFVGYARHHQTDPLNHCRTLYGSTRHSYGFWRDVYLFRILTTYFINTSWGSYGIRSGWHSVHTPNIISQQQNSATEMLTGPQGVCACHAPGMALLLSMCFSKCGRGSSERDCWVVTNYFKCSCIQARASNMYVYYRPRNLRKMLLQPMKYFMPYFVTVRGTRKFYH